MIIEIYDEHGLLNQIQDTLILDLLNYAADRLEIEEDAEMSLSIIDQDQIHRINKEYRDIDRPTDVISFAIEDSAGEEMDIDLTDFDIPRQLGDLFISYDQAKIQAEDYGHSLERELGFLAVHGFLHLNGYDHELMEEERKMFALQEEILEGFGLER